MSSQVTDLQLTKITGLIIFEENYLEIAQRLESRR